MKIIKFNKSELKRKHINGYNFMLAVILFSAFFLRFWHYNVRYGIGADGSRDAIVSYEAKNQLQLPLTGSFSSVGPITFGPWYYYYLTLANFLIPSIWAPWISIGLASFLMVYIMYGIGRLLLGKKFGLILAFVNAFSPAQISAATSLQQHALIGLLSALIIYLLLKIYLTSYTSKLFILWGFIIGIAINTHFQAVELITILIVYFFFAPKKKFVFPVFFGFFISFIPILIFELNNHWFNTRNVVDYFLVAQYRVWTSNRWLTFLTKFWPEFWSYTLGIPYIASLVVMVASISLWFYNIFRRKIQSINLIILISFCLEVIILRYYRGEKFFGYLQFFHPYIFIFTGFLFYKFIEKLNIHLTILGAVLYLYVVFPVTLNYTTPDKLTVDTANRLHALTKIFPNSKFSTYLCNIYDRDRIQGLTLFLYMHHLYDERGRKIVIYNQSCQLKDRLLLPENMVDITDMSNFSEKGFLILSPKGIYEDSARWWFKEQP